MIEGWGWPEWFYAALIVFNVSVGIFRAGAQLKLAPVLIPLIAAPVSVYVLHAGGFW